MPLGDSFTRILLTFFMNGPRENSNFFSTRKELAILPSIVWLNRIPKCMTTQIECECMRSSLPVEQI